MTRHDPVQDARVEFITWQEFLRINLTNTCQYDGAHPYSALAAMYTASDCIVSVECANYHLRHHKTLSHLDCSPSARVC
jgi:hypothetical protein